MTETNQHYINYGMKQIPEHSVINEETLLLRDGLV